MVHLTTSDTLFVPVLTRKKSFTLNVFYYSKMFFLYTLNKLKKVRLYLLRYYYLKRFYRSKIVKEGG